MDYFDLEYINKETKAYYKPTDIIDWNFLSFAKSLSEEFIENFQNRLNWKYVSSYQILSEPFIEKFQHKVSWLYVSKCQKLSEFFIEKYQNEVDWFFVSSNQKLSEGFIEKHQDKVSWQQIFMNQSLSGDFIERYQYNDRFNFIPKYQKLPEGLIDKFFDTFCLENIMNYQKLSDGFIEKYKLKVDKDDLWQYKPAEFKKRKLVETGKYECHEDYFIAYKAIRKDRYSLYNFQYRYLPGGTYESHCDCTGNEDSFGLNVGTYDFAKYYLGNRDGIIVKCKVNYEDIGRVVYDGEKVRCFKINLLN